MTNFGHRDFLSGFVLKDAEISEFVHFSGIHQWKKSWHVNQFYWANHICWYIYRPCLGVWHQVASPLQTINSHMKNACALQQAECSWDLSILSSYSCREEEDRLWQMSLISVIQEMPWVKNGWCMPSCPKVPLPFVVTPAQPTDDLHLHKFMVSPFLIIHNDYKIS